MPGAGLKDQEEQRRWLQTWQANDILWLNNKVEDLERQLRRWKIVSAGAVPLGGLALIIAVALVATPLIRVTTAPIRLSPDKAAGSDVADQGEGRELVSDLPLEQQLERVRPLPDEPLPAPEELLAQPSTVGRTEPSTQPAPAPGQMAAVDPSPSGQSGQASEPPTESATPRPPQRPRSPEPASSSAEPSRPVIEPAPPLPPAARIAAVRPAGSVPPPLARRPAEAALDALIAEVTQTPAPQPDRRTEPTGSRAEAATPAVGREPTTSSTSRPREPQMAATTPSGQLDPGSTGREEREPVITTALGESQSASDSGYRVQLAAVREQAYARRAWDLFMLDLGPILSRYQPYFERANTADGILYRVQIGPFASAESAESICNELRRRNTSCFVVRR